MSRDILRFCKVSLVDDDWIIRATLRKLLIQIGFFDENIFDAGDAASAMQQIVDHKPQIIFCDIHMEPIDGLSLVRELRKHDSRAISQVPVIMLTADAGEKSVMSARDLSISGYIVKPVALSTLERAVARALRIELD